MKYLLILFVSLVLGSSAYAEDTKAPYIPPAKVVESIAPKTVATKPDLDIPEPSAEAIEAGKNTPTPVIPPSYSKANGTTAADAVNAQNKSSGGAPVLDSDAADVPVNPLLPSSAYIKPTWPDILKTMIHFNAIDVLRDDRLLDEYAQIAECDLYVRYFSDDFKWQQIRGMMRESLKINHPDFPVHYYREVKVQLGRYNFDKKLFEFTDKSTIRNVNAIYLLVVADAPCVKKPIKYMSLRYRGVANEPTSILGLSIEQDSANALLAYLTTAKNTDRILTARFNMTVGYVQPLDRSLKAGTKGEVIYQQTSKSAGEIRLDVKVDSVEFFADADKKIRVFTYVPP